MVNFQRWIEAGETITMIKQLNDDKHGHYLFGLFDGFEKRGMVRVPPDKLDFRQQMIEVIKEFYPEVIINVKKVSEL